MSGKSSAGDVVRLTIEELGGLGDGIARHQGAPVYIPLAAPGDVADVLIGGPRGDGVVGRLTALVRASETRRSPPCPYFGECGGCAMQHLAPEFYARWKERLVGAALARQGLVAGVRPMQAPAPDDPGARRRRAVFAAEFRDGAVAAGLNARATRKIVPIAHCLLLTAALNRLIGLLPEMMQAFLAEGERAQAALTDLGGAVDVLVVSPRPPGREARERIADFAARHGIARVSWRTAKNQGAAPEAVVQREPCRVSLGGVAVDFPPGGFLQPSAWGEATLQRLVTEGMEKISRVADLFAGIGTFAFALARAWGGLRWKIAAFERDPALSLALRQASNRAGLFGKLSVETRDLDRRPLLEGELRDLDGIVLDPPRTGAKAQVQVLARAKGPKRAVMVSCNPATFARDARILLGGGWTLEYVTPVDQFLYSAHLELVAVFARVN
ncbi:MAG: class I SAM-dependent RNA methyltransferase [Rhodospirillales bacterium]|nr:class I SAM-dependent RNA methyltransferase [Rhodospirillales bacterium]